LLTVKEVDNVIRKDLKPGTLLLLMPVKYLIIVIIKLGSINLMYGMCHLVLLVYLRIGTANCFRVEDGMTFLVVCLKLIVLYIKADFCHPFYLIYMLMNILIICINVVLDILF